LYIEQTEKADDEDESKNHDQQAAGRQKRVSNLKHAADDGRNVSLFLSKG